MITIEELSAYNRKLVDMNLKLRKENKELIEKTNERYRGCQKVDDENNKTILNLKVKIKDLEKENAELKEELKDANEKVVHLACNQNKDLKRKLTKAKEIINAFLDFEASAMERGCYIADDTRRRAEDFIKE